MPAPIAVRHFSDPACPWAYSAWPALTALRWRYGDGLAWTLTMIGLSEDPQSYVDRGFTPARMAVGNLGFRRFGMPLGAAPRERLAATGRACRAVVATRLTSPAHELAAFRALQLAQFTSAALLDTDAGIRGALTAHAPDLDADAVVAALDDPATEAAYQADREDTRSAAGGPTAFQGKAATAEDGRIRYTAPSLVFTHPDGRSLEAGGFQPLEAYDVCIANLDTALPRRGAAQEPVEVLAAFDHPLATAEVAAVLTADLAERDLEATERALLEAAADGRVRRHGLASSALWSVA